ncbi:hypothetical protein DMH04_14480 [Kibdelosporangium aridum]|uniref:Uncharacterized protein n=1 Tax=Kibdelosporangium aridum TaxID=2030 RepID=A0A428ZE42_KIBAR|nr:hypothetical protein DMH04_14480 [Kibdelosporangium aridum]
MPDREVIPTAMSSRVTAWSALSTMLVIQTGRTGHARALVVADTGVPSRCLGRGRDWALDPVRDVVQRWKTAPMFAALDRLAESDSGRLRVG